MADIEKKDIPIEKIEKDVKAAPAKKKAKVIKAEDTKERRLITIDNTPEEVVSLDREGVLLSFEDEPGKFLELPEKMVEELSGNAYASYMFSLGSNVYLKKKKEHPEDFASGVTVEPRYATATARLKVEGQNPGMHPCWKRPDELQQAAYEGYRIAHGESLRTFMGEGDMVHKVGALGKDELVLTECPQELHDAHMKRVEDKSKSRIASVEREAIEDMRRSGGKAYVPDEDDAEWSEVRR